MKDLKVLNPENWISSPFIVRSPTSKPLDIAQSVARNSLTGWCLSLFKIHTNLFKFIQIHVKYMLIFIQSDYPNPCCPFSLHLMLHTFIYNPAKLCEVRRGVSPAYISHCQSHVLYIEAPYCELQSGLIWILSAWGCSA